MGSHIYPQLPELQSTSDASWKKKKSFILAEEETFLFVDPLLTSPTTNPQVVSKQKSVNYISCTKYTNILISCYYRNKPGFGKQFWKLESPAVTV